MKLTPTEINAMSGEELDVAIAESREARPKGLADQMEGLSIGDYSADLAWVWSHRGWVPADNPTQEGYAALELLEEFRGQYQMRMEDPTPGLWEVHLLGRFTEFQVVTTITASAPDIATAAARCYLLAKAAGIGEEGKI